MSDKSQAPTTNFFLVEGGGELQPISNKPGVLTPDPNQGGYISGTPEESPTDPNFRWQGPPCNVKRDANKTDLERQAHFAAKREVAMLAPPENAMVLANQWGAPYPLVQRIIALEGVVASLAAGQVRLQEAFGLLLTENFELRKHIDDLFSKITR